MLARDRVVVSKLWFAPIYSMCDALPKKDCSTCLSKESIPAIPFGISKHPLPTRSRFLRATVRSTSSALWLHHAHPFVAATEKNQSHAEKQRVCRQLWSPRFVTCNTVIVSKTWTAGCWLIVLSVVTCDCCKPMNSCRDWAFSNSGLEVGLPAFQLPMFAKCDALKEICSACLSKESMPFVKSKSKPPLSTRSLSSLRAAASSTSSALCLHHAHPFVAVTEKDLSHAEKHSVWSRSCGLQDLLQYNCALSCGMTGMRLLQTNQHLSRLSF